MSLKYFVMLLVVIAVVLHLFYSVNDANAICCFPYEITHYVDPQTGFLVVDGQLWNDSYKAEPFGNVNYQFQFFDSENNILFQRDISLTDGLPIKGGFVIPPGVALPFHAVIDDVDKETIMKVRSVSSGGNNTLDYFAWKPADLKVDFKELEKTETVYGKTHDETFYKWKIIGTITNTHVERIKNVYVVASLLEEDGFLGTAGYSKGDIPPLALDGFETKDYTIYAILPKDKTPDNVSLYAESDDSAMIHQHYKPIILKNANYQGLFSTDPKKPIMISANITNISRENLDFDWIIQIKKSPKNITESDMTKYPDSKVEHIKTIPAHIDAQKSTQLDYSWTPQSNGIYFYEMYLWGKHGPVSYPFKGDFMTADWILVNSNLNSITNQIKSGIPLDELECSEGLELVHRASNVNLVCVKPESIPKLIEREWAKSDSLITLGPMMDPDITKEQTIFLRPDIDDLDSGTSFHPNYIKSILGVDNKITWFNAKQEPAHLQSDDNYFNATILPQEKFSYTYDAVGIYKYHDPINWKRGTIFVTTNQIESSNLVPAELFQKSQYEIAKTIATSLITDDAIVNTRLENTIMSAYVTDRDADIIVPASLGILNNLETFDEIQYHYGMTEGLFFPKDEQAGLDFAKTFLGKIGYYMDGSEWIDKVNFGDRIEITIQQKIQGWIIPNHIVQFEFAKDHTWLSLGRWYCDVGKYEFKLSQDDAKKISKDYMDEQVRTNPLWQEYDYQFESIQDGVRAIIFDDKPFYMVPITYKANADRQYEMEHCGSNQFLAVYAMIEGKTGTAMGWNYP